MIGLWGFPVIATVLIALAVNNDFAMENGRAFRRQSLVAGVFVIAAVWALFFAGRWSERDPLSTPLARYPGENEIPASLHTAPRRVPGVIFSLSAMTSIRNPSASVLGQAFVFVAPKGYDLVWESNLLADGLISAIREGLKFRLYAFRPYEHPRRGAESVSVGMHRLCNGILNQSKPSILGSIGTLAT